MFARAFASASSFSRTGGRQAAWLLLLAFCLLQVAVSWAQAPSPTKSPTKAAAEKPKFKAIWEPVNIQEDLELTSVHFVSPDEGWVAGGKNVMQGGVIVHTRDGGQNWEVQTGDSQSSDRAYGELRFVGPTLGFAVQSSSPGDHKLWRTSDGQNWQQVGTVAQHRADYQFTSPDVGFVAGHDTIERTQDAGRHWDTVYQCHVKAEVDGLTRDVSCEFERLDFVNARLGFALSRTFDRQGSDVLARTEDGGATWSAWVIRLGDDGKEGALHFFDASTGVIRAIDGRMFRTTDGGKTWTGTSGQPEGKPGIEFVDDAVGWMIRYSKMIYTTDGGRNWTSREIAFPTAVKGFCLAARDRGYVVGDHGMVYRYRVVPIEYTAKGMLAAPAMPAK